MHPNRIGCRLLGAHLRHAVGTANPNMTVQIRVKDTAARQSRAQGDVQDVQGAAAEFKTKITCHDAFRVPAIVVILLTAVLGTSWDPVGFLY